MWHDDQGNEVYWEDGPIDQDPETTKHFQQARLLKYTLRREFDIRPEVFYPTRDLRGKTKLSLTELYRLIREPDEQPPLICTGADAEKLLTSRSFATNGRFSDVRSQRHAQEVEEAREALAEMGIFPTSAVPTRDMKGRVQLTFEELVKIFEDESRRRKLRKVEPQVIAPVQFSG
jgi:hypothetical protein